MSSDGGPLLDTLTDMTEASVSHTSLGGRELMLVRTGLPAAVDAPVSSYFVKMGVAIEVGLTAVDAQGVLVAIAPIGGAPRAETATATIAEAFGLAVTVDDAIQDGCSPS